MILANIKRHCESKGISLAALERAVGIGNGVIARWNESSPRVDLLKRVADYFGTTVDELLREEDIDAEGTP